MENILNTYRNGKLYKIINNINNSCHVGSTTQDLTIRMAEHIEQYKLWLTYTINYDFITSHKLFNIYCAEPCKIELIENYVCLTKKKNYGPEKDIILKY